MSALPLGYTDPATYLASPSFHRSHAFSPSFLPASAAPHTISYALAGSASRAAPTLVFLNGLGGHRLITSLFDGFLAAHSVRLLTIDRPACGLSTPVPLADRVRWTTEALLAVLSHEGIRSFTLFTHSNGVIYGLPFLLALPPEITCDQWILSAPYAPGSRWLEIAKWVPRGLTGRVGGLAQWGLGVAGGVMKSWGWSGGVVLMSAGTIGLRTVDPKEVTIEKDYTKSVAKQGLDPPSKRGYARTYISEACSTLAMDTIVASGLTYVGFESLMTLHSAPDARWGWPGEDTAGRGEAMYEAAFLELRERKEGLKMRVWYGEEDGLMPPSARRWFRALLVDKLGMVKSDEWTEVEGQGHDGVLLLESVMGDICKAASGGGP